MPLTFPKSLPQGIEIYTEWATLEPHPHNDKRLAYLYLSPATGRPHGGDQRLPLCL